MRTALLTLMCAAGSLLAACGRHDAVPPPPATATAAIAVAAVAPHSAPSMSPPEAPAPTADDEEPMDVSALRLPQPDDTEPVPVK